MRIIGLAGWSGSGKTTLLAKVIPRIAARGLTRLDPQARPSRLRRRPARQGFAHPSHGRRDRGAGRLGAPLGAGARVARRRRAVASTRCCASSRRSISCWSRATSASAIPKLEVYRAANGKPLLHPDDPAIVAVAVGHAAAGRAGAGGRSRRRRCASPTCWFGRRCRSMPCACVREPADGATHRRLLRVLGPAAAGR